MNKGQFALLGRKPIFDRLLPVGQLYFPSWERYESAFHDIFNRRYYTNQGPLVQNLEEKLQLFFGVKHVICVTNATIGLMMAAEALQLTGKVILPSFTFIASAQSISWCGLDPVFCDINPKTHQIDIRRIEENIDNDVSAIMGVNLWGGACELEELSDLSSKHNLFLYFDSAHAFGCETMNGKIGSFGDLEVFSFHATKILNATEGGCLCTNNDDIAARLRNIRSSYGAGREVRVKRTSNGRMSEAQAAIALMSLEDYDHNRANNFKLYESYRNNLCGIQGIKIVEPANVIVSNYQYMVCEINENEFGISRDYLLALLKAENIVARRYFYPGLHRTPEYQNKYSGQKLPVTDYLCNICIQLPIGAHISDGDVVSICDVIRRAQREHESLNKHFLGLSA